MASVRPLAGVAVPPITSIGAITRLRRPKLSIAARTNQTFASSSTPPMTRNTAARVNGSIEDHPRGLSLPRAGSPPEMSLRAGEHRGRPQVASGRRLEQPFRHELPDREEALAGEG